MYRQVFYWQLYNFMDIWVYCIRLNQCNCLIFLSFNLNLYACFQKNDALRVKIGQILNGHWKSANLFFAFIEISICTEKNRYFEKPKANAGIAIYWLFLKINFENFAPIEGFTQKNHCEIANLFGDQFQLQGWASSIPHHDRHCPNSGCCGHLFFLKTHWQFAHQWLDKNWWAGYGFCDFLPIAATHGFFQNHYTYRRCVWLYRGGRTLSGTVIFILQALEICRTNTYRPYLGIGFKCHPETFHRPSKAHHRAFSFGKELELPERSCYERDGFLWFCDFFGLQIAVQCVYQSRHHPFAFCTDFGHRC